MDNTDNRRDAITPLEDGFYERIAELLTRARAHVQTAINTTMVYTYYEIGRMIVEEEQ